jgi:uncharacterized membrane protein YidH (DUF202 family)
LVRRQASEREKDKVMMQLMGVGMIIAILAVASWMQQSEKVTKDLFIVIGTIIAIATALHWMDQQR